ncbi:prepilin-type N-terminal cleavage/methylation domain-containing protein [bacterium]|nr:prepilin-type N-terminal cleavage/methylation domain-containing protein [bacterium]
MRRVKGFTLIELLVVIAIIAILAAILFPVFTGAKAKGKQAACLNNVKQLATAYTIYCDNYDGKLCPYATPGAGQWNPNWHYWMENIMPYVRNYKVFECAARPMGKYSDYNGTYWYKFIGYGINYYYLASNIEGQPGYVPTGFVASTVKNPAKTVFLVDSIGRTVQSGDVPTDGPYTYNGQSCIYSDIATPKKLPNEYIVSDCHNGGAIVAWCDGHASWMKKTKLCKDTSLWDLY